MNKLVHIYRYVTEGTFDAYLFQLVEKKQKMVGQIMTSKTPMRSIEGFDDVALAYAEIKGLASGNPLIKEKTELDAEVIRLKLLKQNYLNQKYSLEDMIAQYYPDEITRTQTAITNMTEDYNLYTQSKEKLGEEFSQITINEKTYYDKELAGKAILAEMKNIEMTEYRNIGNYRGFELSMLFDSKMQKYTMKISNKYNYKIELGTDIYGNLTRIENALKGIESKLESNKTYLTRLEEQLKVAKEEVKTEFKYETQLNEAQKRLDEINIILKLDDKKEKTLDIYDDSIEDKNDEPKYNREKVR